MVDDYPARTGSAASNRSHKTSSANERSQSTPDITGATGPDDLTQIPYVPDNALASSTVRNGKRPDHTGPELVPIVEDYSVFDHSIANGTQGHNHHSNQNSGGGSHHLQVGGGGGEGDHPLAAEWTITPTAPIGRSNRQTESVDASSNDGNPFVVNDATERQKRKQAKQIRQASDSHDSNPGKRTSQEVGFGFNTNKSNNSSGQGEDAYDPFGGTPLDLARNGSRQQSRGSSSRGTTSQNGGVRITNSVDYEDPFAAFGKQASSHVFGHTGTENSGGGGGDDPFNRTGSLMRRKSQFEQQVMPKKADPHHRKSVTSQLALVNPRGSMRDEDGQEPIGVLATNPAEPKPEGGYSAAAKAEVSSRGTNNLDKAAEQLFMPNMKREQYVPVRVARDKIKQVLSEMAQMRTMHLSAIETMEKQHSFLKAQLESACAAYCRKLTADYNNRVLALNHEFKRRLETGGVKPATPPTPPPSALSVELQTKVAALEARCAELQQQLVTSQAESDSHRQAMHETLERADAAEEEVASLKETVSAFERKLASFEMMRKSSISAQQKDHEKTEELEIVKQELEDVKAENQRLREQQQPEAADMENLRAENAALQEQLERLQEECKELRGY